MARSESSNPVFQRSQPLRESLGGYGPDGRPVPSAQDVADIYGAPQRLTMDDIAVKTGILLGLLVTTGFAAIAVGTLNLISIAFAILFVGIAVDFAIQFSVRFREMRLDHPGPRRADLQYALARTARRAGVQILIAAAATAATAPARPSGSVSPATAAGPIAPPIRKIVMNSPVPMLRTSGSSVSGIRSTRAT